MLAVRHGQARKINVLQEKSSLFAGLPAQFQIGLYHSWAVSTERFPSELEITAVDDENVVMAIQHRYLPIYGVQFHPESYISEGGRILISNFLKV